MPSQIKPKGEVPKIPVSQNAARLQERVSPHRPPYFLRFWELYKGLKLFKSLNLELVLLIEGSVLSKKTAHCLGTNS